MANKSYKKVNLAELQKMEGALKKMADARYEIQVGVFGEKAARRNEAAGLTNAEVGLIQEMGSNARHIPRRSFLYDTFALHGRELADALKVQVATLFKTGKVEEYLKQAGIAATNLVLEAFQTSGWGAWAPNAYSTLLRKLKGELGLRKQQAAAVMHEGATYAKPLMDTGQLSQAISARTARA